jgi:hypothetical protein
MTDPAEPIYPQSRAIEHAADLPGVRPLRIYRLTLPLFEVEISALIDDPQPYDLLDRFVTRAIGYAQWRSVPEIAGALGLDETLSARIVAMLTDIGHVAVAPDGSLGLTELGDRSLRADRRYVPKHDRQRLYFDGVRGEPLPAAHYEKGVAVLDRESALAQRSHRLLGHACPFRNDAVARLVRSPDRDAYNLPDELWDVSFVAVDDAYLPFYLVRTVSDGGLGLLAYSKVAELRDPHLERICSVWQDVSRTLATDDADDDGDLRAHFGDWLRRRDLSPRDLTWVGDPPALRLTLPRSRFEKVGAAQKRFGLTQLGSYVAPEGHVLQLWCDDSELRRAAVRERALIYATTGKNRSAGDVGEFLERVSRQLDVTAVTLSDLRRHARSTGHGELDI